MKQKNALVIISMVIITSLVCFILSFSYARKMAKEAKKENGVAIEVEAIAKTPAAPEPTAPEPTAPEEPTAVSYVSPINFEEIGADAVGYIDGYGINYPIMQKYHDNDWYNTHDVIGNISTSASIYVDGWNGTNFDDKVTYIYGHNMRQSFSGPMMFGNIEEDWKAGKKELENFTIYLPDREMNLQVVAVIKTTMEDNQLYQNPEEFTDYPSWVDYVNKNNQDKDTAGVDASKNSIVISTCSGIANSGKRFCLILQEK